MYMYVYVCIYVYTYLYIDIYIVGILLQGFCKSVRFYGG